MTSENRSQPTESSKEIVNEIIKNKFKTSNFTIEIEEGANKGDNYLGIVFRVIATNNDTKEKLSIFLKIAPQIEARRHQFFTRSSFLRESLFYDEFFPMLKEFQMSKGINLMKDGFHHVPECFKTSTKEYEETILMQDLRTGGFEMFDRHKEMSFEHAKLVMETLGKFHAVSLALKDQQPEKMVKISSLIEPFFEHAEEDSMKKFYSTMYQRALTTLDADKEGEIVEKAKSFYSLEFKDVVKSCLVGKDAEPYAVLCHGDTWNNNMLFKYDQNGTPTDIRLLDWQIIKFASPVTDLMYYFFTTTSKEFRDQYYEDLLHIYHNSLLEHLEKLGSDRKLFPYSAFEEHLKRFGKFGLFITTMLLSLFTTKAEDVPNLDEITKSGADVEENCFNNPASDTVYRLKMGNVIRDMCRLGYI